jgi:heptosyltransferase-2
MDLKKSTGKIIAIAPGSNWFTKRWPEKYYEDLVKTLSESNYGIVFIGSNEERELCEKIKPLQKSINIAGELSLLESAAVVKLCDLMICNDSGALHLADAMQTDVLAFFGPTVKSIGYYPFRDNDKVLEVDLDCRPCSSHGTNTCPLGHHNCMKFIEPDFVIKEVNAKLA